MIKVKEFLDKNFLVVDKSSAYLKKNGHHCVTGSWSYPTLEFNDKFYIRCRCNNETLRIDIINPHGKKGIYGYLQTYQHIPRGDADNNGYYLRSTDNEIIKYILSYIIDLEREKKLNQLLNG